MLNNLQCIKLPKKKLISKVICLAVALSFVLNLTLMAFAESENEDSASQAPVELNAKSVILMDSGTNTVLYEYNADEKRSPASITKIMTMLLVMEAIDEGRFSFDDMVTISDHAHSFGGSTIFLEAGESLSVHDLLRGTAVASANDAAVALAEFVAGSETAFVQMMNEKAAELGMTNTQFKNAHGLDEEGHYSTARDIAIMSSELMKHEEIFNYTQIWMDTITKGNGSFELVNTNKLIRFYPNATGLKTGTTNKAGSCISATAQKDGLHLIAVVLGAPDSTQRNETAKALLEYGFANWTIAQPAIPPEIFQPVKVIGGVEDSVEVVAKTEPSTLVKKGEEVKLECTTEMSEAVHAPITAGETVGKLTVKIGDNVVDTVDIIAASDVEEMTIKIAMNRICKIFLSGNGEETD